MAEYLIHLPDGYENTGVPVYPADAPQCAECAAWELAEVRPEPETWLLLTVAAGLTLAEARSLAEQLGATRIVGG